MKKACLSFFFPSFSEPCRTSLHSSITSFLRGICIINEYPVISPLCSELSFNYNLLICDTMDLSPSCLCWGNGCEFIERSELKLKEMKPAESSHFGPLAAVVPGFVSINDGVMGSITCIFTELE